MGYINQTRLGVIMRLLLILLFLSFNAHADLATCKTDVTNKFLEMEDNIHWLMHAAGLSHIPNPRARLRDKLQGFANETQCRNFETTWINPAYAKIPEYLALLADREAKESEFETAKTFLSGYDCNSLSGVNKAICVIVKHKVK